jgi:propanediol dehydratase small subunit
MEVVGGCVVCAAVDVVVETLPAQALIAKPPARPTIAIDATRSSTRDQPSSLALGLCFSLTAVRLLRAMAPLFA